ncbi:MAG: ABC transporter permease [Ruminococcaceae bacterium]|nr:ABC transporter permease [Oscillospiraceae bacterium]
MKINSAKYFIKEAFKNVFSNGWMSIASVFTVIASLLVFGLFMVLALNLNHMVGQVESDYEITLTVTDEFTPAQITELGNTLRGVTNVSEVIFVSKDERMEQLKDRFGENRALLEDYKNERNPLSNWYKIRCEDLSQSNTTVEEIKRLNGVAKVISNQDTIQKLTTASGYISRMSGWIMLALAVISVFIISNTIKLTVFSRRREINIMKFVGATDWFIRWPFIIEGVLIGILGSVLSGALVCIGYQGLTGLFDSLNIAMVQFLPLGSISFLLFGAFVIMGMGMGAVGSLISVRKYLKV